MYKTSEYTEITLLIKNTVVMNFEFYEKFSLLMPFCINYSWRRISFFDNYHNGNLNNNIVILHKIPKTFTMQDY